MALFDLLSQLGGMMPPQQPALQQEDPASVQLLKQVQRPRRFGDLQRMIQGQGQVSTPPPVSPQEAALVQAPPPAPTVTQHTGGFMSRLKDALIGTVLMGPVGGIASAFNPQLAHNARFNLIDSPRYQQQQKFQSVQDSARAQRAVELGAMSGVNPLSGRPTLGAGKQEDLQNQREVQNQLREMQMNQQLQIAGQNLSQKEDALNSRETMFKDKATYDRNKFVAQQYLMDYRKGNRDLTPQIRQFVQDATGYDLSGAPDHIEPMQMFPVIDESGTFRVFPIPKGQTTPFVAPGAGKPSSPSSLGLLSEAELDSRADAEISRKLPPAPRPPTEEERILMFIQKKDADVEYQKKLDEHKQQYDKLKKEIKDRLRKEMGVGSRPGVQMAPDAPQGQYEYRRDPQTGKTYRRNISTGQIEEVK